MQSVIYGKTVAHLVDTRGTKFENHCSKGMMLQELEGVKL
jgi:hypothetical protein